MATWTGNKHQKEQGITLAGSPEKAEQQGVDVISADKATRNDKM